MTGFVPSPPSSGGEGDIIIVASDNDDVGEGQGPQSRFSSVDTSRERRRSKWPPLTHDAPVASDVCIVALSP